jgi:signal transduction histidine kinase/DNA-binding NarL/FixJ family response regulator
MLIEPRRTLVSSAFLDGGGEMGALMRAMDWTKTPLGPIEGWPQSLRTTVSTCLNSRFPILIWWGPELVKLYNDAYRELLVEKHPAALGRAGREVWPEIWHIIGPMLESVVKEGRATWSEDQFLPLERRGYPEECYFTFSYSPIHDETGGIGGVFCAVTETTGRVIGERRLRLLQELASHTPAETVQDVCVRAMHVLAGDSADVPFALIYLLDADRRTLHFIASTGSGLTGDLTPATVTLDAADDDPGGWPFRRVLESGAMALVDPPDTALCALVVPVNASQGSAVGVLVAGCSPKLPITDQYRGFAALIAREIGGSLTNARVLEDERRRVEALAEIDRAKTVFFSNVSHEFRTPLTLMLSPVEEALASDEQTLGRHELGTVHRNALRLLKLVNTLLDFARIESGRARVVLQPTDLAQLTADLASTFRSAMDRAGLTFEVHCPPLSGPVQVDREAWEKIVLNLLSNALKFTFTGAVELSLSQAEDHVDLRVQDTGVGIPEHELPRLFDRFHRVQGVEARTHEGSGIGLALVNELVRMHGGSLTATSTLGSGTTFTVSIPARVSTPAGAVEREFSAESAEAAARPYVTEALRWLPGTPPAIIAEPSDTLARRDGSTRILLADDNADMREYVTRLLGDRWTIQAVADGAAALDAARTHPPTLVISDVMMPRLDGFQLLRALRADPMTQEIPVILLSARAGEEASIEGLEAGADDYIVKPFSARELRARVEAQLLRGEVRAIAAAHDRRLREIFHRAPVAIAMLHGPEHVFEFANEKYLAVIGRRPIVGKKLCDALPELIEQGIGDIFDQVYAAGQPYSADSLCVTLNRGPHGAPEQAYFNFVYQPVRDLGGQVEGIAVIAVDVTELATSRQEAEAANRAKDHFLAVLGHELRNPLAPIITAAQLLELKGPKDPALQRLRETISRQAHLLLKIVEDLLDVARIITGKLRLEKARVDVNAIVRQAVETVSPLIQQRHHTLNVQLPPTPIYVDADAPRMCQVVCNLLTNAAKYTPLPGAIELTAYGESERAFIRVRDHGVGIAPEMLVRVFDRFVQGSDPNTMSSDGLGIGLSVVKTIVELHGGSVVAHSNGPGTGSEFTVSIPVVPPASSPAVAVHDSQEHL